MIVYVCIRLLSHVLLRIMKWNYYFRLSPFMNEVSHFFLGNYVRVCLLKFLFFIAFLNKYKDYVADSLPTNLT